MTPSRIVFRLAHHINLDSKYDIIIIERNKMENQDLGFWFGTAVGVFVFIALMIWSLIWKGRALWKAAQNKDKSWYVIMLIVNTVGILEIIYIFLISPKKNK